MDPKRTYTASCLEESLGLAVGDVEPGSIPADLVDSISGAMRGDAAAASERPEIEHRIQAYSAGLSESMLDSRGFVLSRARWPQDAPYAACLTHDIDNLARPISHIWARRDRFSREDLVLALLGLRDLYDNTAIFADLEAARGLHSSFYFLTSEYDLGRKASQLNDLSRRGWDIGLHGDFGTHDSAPNMAASLAKFKRATGIAPVGVREHYLKFDYGSTWALMDEAGFVYDTTVGNTDRLGFRLGLCTPFHPPDSEWRPRRLLELPLALMDATLWGYLKKNEQEGAADVESMKKSVSEVNGLFTLLWHPESGRMKGGRIYASVLDGLKRDGCFIGSGSEIARWWSMRSAPLRLEGRDYRMDDAPKGMVMRFKAKGGAQPRVKGGMASVDGSSTVVRADGGPVSVEVP